MAELDLDAVRAGLERERDRIGGRVETFAERPELGSAQGFGKRIGDGTIEAVSRLTEIGVGRSLETRLERIEHALAKLDAGTYGRCETCGEPIGSGRLRAVPESVECITCASASQAAGPVRRR